VHRVVPLAIAVVAACSGNKVIDAHYEVAVAACSSAGTNIVFRQIAITQSAAILVTSPPGDARQFVIEQEGRIRILDHGVYQPAASAFLDLSGNNNGPVICCGEQGLLGLAFDPDYATNRQFYIAYTAGNPANDLDNPYLDIIERYTTKATDPSHADPTSAQVILQIPDFAVNHNGGMLEFGSDGDLYMGTGDGGGANDPHTNGQNTSALLGKMLRIDVDHPAAGSAYGIPADNPFASGGGAPEIYLVGTRNPWRWSFDSATGDMWIGDVGQDTIEELDYLPAGQQKGTNLGWSMYEGNNCFHGPCDTTGKLAPVYFRPHSDGWCSIIGGEVYRGACFPDLVGTYFFTDYCAHQLVESRVNGDGTVSSAPVATSGVSTINLDGSTSAGMPANPSSLHADASGELWLTVTACCGSSTNGAVYHLEATP
jgi:hypothetical protein